jgi:hypothetical protein
VAVNTGMNLDIHNTWELSWPAEEPVVSQGKISNMEFWLTGSMSTKVFLDITCGAQRAYAFACIYQ